VYAIYGLTVVRLWGQLGADNAWICPSCRRRQQCTKKLSLWSVPDIFIIHLKRFRQSSQSQRNKVTTQVVFPQNGLGMSCQRSLSPTVVIKMLVPIDYRDERLHSAPVCVSDERNHKQRSAGSVVAVEEVAYV
jgi:hypothetical protein